ncbi:MAG: hypothetical protein AAF806_06270 [Bacteroidota bacterium]
MKIVNPIYDYAFKYLMQNERIAKKVLSTLLGCEVLELTIEQQEIIVVETNGLKLYRLDFSAIILDEEGKKQKVLIELQKSKLPTNLLRFRTYLGESYTKREVVKDASGVEESKVYPIISIYLLGYNVVDIPYLAVNIDNRITNTVTKEVISVQSDFVELLTHKTRIIQVRRLSEDRKSRLEQFLTLFNQAWVTSERYIIDLEEVPDDFSDVANYLSSPVKDEAFRKQLRAEEEIDEIFKRQEAEIAMKDELIKQERQKVKEEQQKVKEEQQRVEKEKQQKEALQIEFAKFLITTGVSVEEVANKTGLSTTAVNDLKTQL